MKLATTEGIVGSRYGRMTIVGLGKTVRAKNGRTRRIVVAVCDCGNLRDVRLDALRSGKTMGCGCLRIEFVQNVLSKSAVTHGQSKTPLHKIWVAMKQRCNNPSHRSWGRYGGRGIRVCERWSESFESFAADMGPRPDGASIDRIDNDGHYEPANCRWAGLKEQGRNKQNNRVIEFNGQTRCLTEWSEVAGINIVTLWNRLAKGVPAAVALTLPVRKARL